MNKKSKFYAVVVFFLVIGLVLDGRPWSEPLFGKGSEHHVYVAFGFHVNLAHSYRVDRNDEGGFGKDIRIIRRIIQSLDQANQKGIPVKAVWDLDNLFSLERFLPQYAPDIIDDLNRRIQKDGDEAILMSYNNALGSTLNQKEFETSVNRAVTNARGSGVKDLFGRFSPIVRPQEMMAGPGCYGMYRNLGIEAVVLYYSAITFDGFRVFADQLSRAEAFNPLLYQNRDTGEEITVIPAYNIGDLLENGSLTQMAESLHQEQVRGRIDRDVLIFVNFDADDEFWTGYDLPWHLAWMPNTGGLQGVIDNVADLEYVRFTTLASYLTEHPPVGKVEFGQDMADGNFNGYNNWAEKALTSKIWTAVEADRRTHRMAHKALSLSGLSAWPEEVKRNLDRSFKQRLELLSTTNFGMSVPDVAPARRRRVEDMTAEMKAADQDASRAMTRLIRQSLADTKPIAHPRGLRFLDTLALVDSEHQDPGSGFFLTLDLSDVQIHPEDDLFLQDRDGNTTRTVRIEQTSRANRNPGKIKLFLPQGLDSTAGPFSLLAGHVDLAGAGQKTARVEADTGHLQNEFLRVTFDAQGLVEGVFFKGRQVLQAGGLAPLITYRTGDRMVDYRPQSMEVTVVEDGTRGAGVIRLTSPLTLPDLPTQRQGRVNYVLTLLPGVPYLYVEAGVNYPQTTPETLLSGAHPALVGYVDRNWIQVAPAELKPILTANREKPFTVHKKNYLGTESSYNIDYFKHSSRNLNLADVNNHITADYVAVTGLEGGLAVAMDTTVLANFAFCPLKVEHQPRGDWFKLRLNPFGTYFGPQYTQPSWGSGLGYQTALSAGGQYYSSAPSYNAERQSFSLMLSFFEGSRPPDRVKKDLNAFAHPPEVIFGGPVTLARLDRTPGHPLTEPLKLAVTSDDERVYFHWTQAAGSVKSYKLVCRPAGEEPDRKWSTCHLSLETDQLEPGKQYLASVVALDENGQESPASQTVQFTPGEWQNAKPLDLPLFLQIKLMTAGLVNLVR